MIPFEHIDAKTARGIQYLLCDVDDTITTKGKLTAGAYAALWALQEGGIGVIPVTGRPAGWCDMMIRQWPIQAVIGENGAFVYYREGLQIKAFCHPSVATGDVQGHLKTVRDACLAGVPGARVAKDQFARIYDVAIDFNEDPPHLGLEAAQKIKAICESLGATAKVSSIHVNAWFGNYDKVGMARLFFSEVLGIEDPRDRALFFGDSPNDEPMFAYFPHSCAVANIRPFTSALASLPRYIAREESGAGFVASVRHLLELRQG